MSGDLSRIDWHNHDGVNLSMINDFVRNQFYDRIMRENVQGCDVLDIGFGTGLLSMLALQHGAKSITAYESDPDRYLLGTEIIKQLGLKDKINLVNDRFYHDYLDQYPNHVIVTETVNGNLWQEGLFNSLPRRPGWCFLPGEYFLNIYTIEIPTTFAQGLGCHAYEKQFCPGIDISPNFVNTVNFYYGVNTHNHTPKLPQLKHIDPHVDTNWGWIPYQRCIADQLCNARYVLNVKKNLVWTLADGKETTAKIDFTREYVDISLNVQTKKSLLVVPRVGMQHSGQTLFLDLGHWGPTLSPVVITDYSGNLLIKHNLHSGDITYELTH